MQFVITKCPACGGVLVVPPLAEEEGGVMICVDCVTSGKHRPDRSVSVAIEIMIQLAVAARIEGEQHAASCISQVIRAMAFDEDGQATVGVLGDTLRKVANLIDADQIGWLGLKSIGPDVPRCVERNAVNHIGCGFMPQARARKP